MDRAVAEGVFPYGEWALFDKTGVREAGATEGEGGRWFDLASLTKPHTATALLAVAAEGRVGLDDPVGGLLGEAQGALGARLAGMTLRALLTHTAGLPAWYPFYADGRPFFEILADLPPGQPGMVYSDIGYLRRYGPALPGGYPPVCGPAPGDRPAVLLPRPVPAPGALLPGQRGGGEHVPGAGDGL